MSALNINVDPADESEVAQPVVTFTDVKPQDRKAGTLECLRAAFAHCRHLLRPPGGRVEGNLLLLLVSACAGQAVARNVASNFEQRINVLTGEAKTAFTIKEFIDAVEQELTPKWRLDRAKAGLSTVSGACELYNRVNLIKAKKQNASDWELFQEAVQMVIKEVHGSEHFIAELENSPPEDNSDKLAGLLPTVWSECHAADATAARYAPLRQQEKRNQAADLEAILRGSVVSSWPSDSSESASGWFHDNVLRVAAANSCLAQDVKWRAATFRGEAHTGLDLLQVHVKYTGQNWLTVQRVAEGSTAEFKKVRLGMLLYRVQQRIVIGLSPEQLSEITLEERPLSMEFINHTDGPQGEHLEGDFRYDIVVRELQQQEEDYDDFEHVPVLISSRVGMHRRKGGNQNMRGSSHQTEKKHDHEWKEGNQFLNGAAKAKAAARSRAIPGNYDPDHPVVSGRALGCIPPDDPLRIKINRQMNKPEIDHFILGCIAVNTFILAVQSPENEYGDFLNSVMNYLDIILCVIFSVEMTCRVYSLGLLLGPTSYLRYSAWNVLDFVVVMGSWVQFVLWLSNSIGGTNVSFLRSARALRPLRSMRHFNGIKRIMASLRESISVMIGVTGMMMFCFALFACIGGQLFSAALTLQCDDGREGVEDKWEDDSGSQSNISIGNESGCPDMPFIDRSEWQRTKCPLSMHCDSGCLVVPKYGGGEYTGDHTDEVTFWGFDDAAGSVMTLFIVTTEDEWPALADPIRTSDTTFQSFAWIYFALAVLVIAMVVSNLFIAVVTLAFAKSRQGNADIGALSGENFKEIAEREKEERKRRGREPGEITHEQRVETKYWPYLGMGTTPVSIRAKVVVEHWAFEAFIMTIVMLNTVLMATEHHGQTQAWVDTVNAVEATFFVIYSVELIAKIIGLSWKVYWESKFNWLDYTLVTLSLIQYIVEAVVGNEGMQGFALGRLLRLARLFRAARIVRLLRKYKSVMKLITTVISSWAAIANVCIFIMILVTILAIMGLQLYGADVEGHEVPRANFRTFGRALLTVYQIFTGEDWSPIMFGYMHTHGYQAWGFFVTTFVVTNFALANLFVAVILENFEVAEDSKLELQQLQYQKSERYLELMMNVQEREEAQWSSMNSPAESTIRRLSQKIAESALFSNIVLLSIIGSSIALAVEGPPDAEYLEDQPTIVTILGILDVFFFVLFWTEVILKITYMGIYPKNPESYFNDSWNCLDFFIVISTSVDFVAHHAKLGDDFTWTGIFRTFRVLRPLRVVQHHENIRVVLDSLLSAATTVSATLVLAGFFFLVFGILSINLFKGLLFSCCEEIPTISCEAVIQLDRADCEPRGFHWVNAPVNFDNFGNAMQALFVVATLEGWVDVMNQVLDVTEVDMAPVYNNSQIYSIFFVAFTLLGGFFITNLFVGVLVDQFMQSSGSGLMTDEQEKWARFEMMCFTADTAKTIETAEDREIATKSMSLWQKKAYMLAKSPEFDNFISTIIIVNVVVMLMERHPAPAFYEHGVEHVEMAFMLIYTVEIVVKVIGLGWFGEDGYWINKWNRLDLSIVVGCWVTYYLDLRAGIQGVRTIRILRLVLEHGGPHSIPKAIVHTLKLSIPPAINVVAATLLIMFVFAIAGMQLYGNIPLCEGNLINEQQNFSNIVHAIMFLYQVATGADFISIVLELRHIHNAPLPFAFFAMYYVMSIFVFLNLFVAVLLDKFEREFGGEDDDIDVSVEELQQFKHEWVNTVRGLNLPKDSAPSWVKACFQSAPKTPDMPLRNLRGFVKSLPDGWVLGKCRSTMSSGLWFNTLLVALEEEEAHPGWHVEEVHTALSIEESTVDLEMLHPDDPRRKVEMPLDSDGVSILDHKVSFIAVVHGLMFLGKESMDGLDYAKQVEHDVRLLERRTKTAKRLMCIFVHAWRANKYQPPQWQQGEEWFAKEGWREAGFQPGAYNCDVNQRTWSLNVRTARDWMLSAVISRAGVGWDKDSAFVPRKVPGSGANGSDGEGGVIAGPSPRNMVMASMQAESTGESREGAMSEMFAVNPLRETEWAGVGSRSTTI